MPCHCLTGTTNVGPQLAAHCTPPATAYDAASRDAAAWPFHRPHRTAARKLLWALPRNASSPLLFLTERPLEPGGVQLGLGPSHAQLYSGPRLASTIDACADRAHLAPRLRHSFPRPQAHPAATALAFVPGGLPATDPARANGVFALLRCLPYLDTPDLVSAGRQVRQRATLARVCASRTRGLDRTPTAQCQGSCAGWPRPTSQLISGKHRLPLPGAVARPTLAHAPALAWTAPRWPRRLA